MVINAVMKLFFVALSWLNLCEGYIYYVGGRDGWVTKPSEEYNHWAETNWIQVNDTLLFKYKKGEESVLVVTRDNYMNCYTRRALQNLTDRETEFKLKRLGPYYFISGNEDHCKQGQRLIVVSPHVVASPRDVAPPPMVAPPHEVAVSHLSPSMAPKSSFAARSGGGSLALCMGVVGVVALPMNN